MPEVHMNRMTWQEYRERVTVSKAPIFLPVGALEQHGCLSEVRALEQRVSLGDQRVGRSLAHRCDIIARALGASLATALD